MFLVCIWVAGKRQVESIHASEQKAIQAAAIVRRKHSSDYTVVSVETCN